MALIPEGSPIEQALAPIMTPPAQTPVPQPLVADPVTQIPAANPITTPAPAPVVPPITTPPATTTPPSSGGSGKSKKFDDFLDRVTPQALKKHPFIGWLIKIMWKKGKISPENEARLVELGVLKGAKTSTTPTTTPAPTNPLSSAPNIQPQHTPPMTMDQYPSPTRARLAAMSGGGGIAPTAAPVGNAQPQGGGSDYFADLAARQQKSGDDRTEQMPKA